MQFFYSEMAHVFKIDHEVRQKPAYFSYMVFHQVSMG